MAKIDGDEKLDKNLEREILLKECQSKSFKKVNDELKKAQATIQK
jgi:hypothetical protein